LIVSSWWQYTRNSIRLPCAYAPYAKNIYFLVWKKFKRKISHIHLHNPYAFVKVSRKNDIAWGQCKNDKTCTIKCLLVSIKICLFYVGQTTSQFFVKRLCAHTTCEDVHANFLFEFFWHFKMYQILYLNNGSICTWEPKQQSHNIHTLLYTSISIKFYNVVFSENYSSVEITYKYFCLSGILICSIFLLSSWTSALYVNSTKYLPLSCRLHRNSSDPCVNWTITKG
jgi:hypothetical protein